ncbi:MAG: hypothetical protein ACOCVR_00680 [Myxococcota bacterium]
MAARPKAYRPYRIAVYVSFIVIVTVLVALPFLGVLRGLLAGASVEPAPIVPQVTSETGEPLSPAEAAACLDAFERLREELDSSFDELRSAAARSGREALQHSRDRMLVWEATHEAIAQRCRIAAGEGGRSAEALSSVSASLGNLARTYNGLATRLVLEEGHVLQDVSASFEEAESALRGEGAGER